MIYEQIKQDGTKWCDILRLRQSGLKDSALNAILDTFKADQGLRRKFDSQDSQLKEKIGAALVPEETIGLLTYHQSNKRFTDFQKLVANELFPK
jgi:hypothetical protein